MAGLILHGGVKLVSLEVHSKRVSTEAGFKLGNPARRIESITVPHDHICSYNFDALDELQSDARAALLGDELHRESVVGYLREARWALLCFSNAFSTRTSLKVAVMTLCLADRQSLLRTKAMRECFKFEFVLCICWNHL